MILKDTILSEWPEDPVAYGAYEENRLIWFVEGILEKWNNRFRIANIIIFDENSRRKGIDKKLIDCISEDAMKLKARMIVLETQSYNYPGCFLLLEKWF